MSNDVCLSLSHIKIPQAPFRAAGSMDGVRTSGNLPSLSSVLAVVNVPSLPSDPTEADGADCRCGARHAPHAVCVWVRLELRNGR